MSDPRHVTYNTNASKQTMCICTRHGLLARSSRWALWISGRAQTNTPCYSVYKDYCYLLGSSTQLGTVCIQYTVCIRLFLYLRNAKGVCLWVCQRYFRAGRKRIIGAWAFLPAPFLISWNKMSTSTSSLFIRVKCCAFSLLLYYKQVGLLCCAMQWNEASVAV